MIGVDKSFLEFPISCYYNDDCRYFDDSAIYSGSEVFSNSWIVTCAVIFGEGSGRQNG